MPFILGVIAGLAAWGSYIGVASLLKRSPRLRDQTRPERPGPVLRVLIWGAGQMGEIAYHHIQNCRSDAFEIVGYIDRDTSLKYGTLHNLPILGTEGQLANIIRKYRIKVVFGSIREPDLELKRNVEQICSDNRVKYSDLSHHILATEDSMDEIYDTARAASASSE